LGGLVSRESEYSWPYQKPFALPKVIEASPKISLFLHGKGSRPYFTYLQCFELPSKLYFLFFFSKNNYIFNPLLLGKSIEYL